MPRARFAIASRCAFPRRSASRWRACLRLPDSLLDPATFRPEAPSARGWTELCPNFRTVYLSYKSLLESLRHCFTSWELGVIDARVWEACALAPTLGGVDFYLPACFIMDHQCPF